MGSIIKGASSSIFAKGVKKSLHEDEVHKSIILPHDLHGVVSEIAFHEEIKMKDIIVSALEAELNRWEQASMANDNKIIKEKEQISAIPSIHTSVIVPKQLSARLRKVAHYSKIHEKELIAYGVMNYIEDRYQEEFPDLLRQLNQKHNIMEA